MTRPSRDDPMPRRSRLRTLYLHRWRGLLAALVLSVVTVAAGTGLLGVSGWFLTGAALAGAGSVFNLFVPSALVRAFSFIRIGARYAERVVGHSATLRLLADLRGTVFRSLMQLSPRQLARYRGGDLVARLTGDVDALDTVFLFVAAPVATALLAGAVLALVVGWWLPAAGLAVALALLTVCVLVPLLLVRASRRPGAALQESAAGLRSAVLDAVEGHADILAMHASAPAQQRFDQLCGHAARARQGQARIAAAGQWLLQAAAGAAMMAVLWVGLAGLPEGRVSGPLLAGLVLATIGIFEVAGPVMRGVSKLGAAQAAAARIRDIIAAEPDLADPSQPLPLPASGRLRARGVRYAYPEAAPGAWVLDGVDLDVAPGERVAIEGASGSGKSTLLHLLLRLDDPQAGQVTYGGCDVRLCAQQALHERVILLSQDAPVFLGTVRTNLLIGNPDADDAALWNALAAARLDGFVRELPQGLDTWVGETGAGLSAGQARRLCLARAVLSRAAVVLLDEPTAGLDAATEADFLRDLEHAVQGRTVVLATHAALPEGAVDRRLRLHAGRLETASASPRSVEAAPAAASALA